MWICRPAMCSTSPMGAALVAYMEATSAGHPTGGVDVDTAYGRQVSAYYAAAFLALYGVAALGREGFEGLVGEMINDL